MTKTTSIWHYLRTLSVILILATLFTQALAESALADDVHVRGYYRKDGTYVQPHVRSAPDSYRWNNYGPSRSDNERLNPRQRDNDRDGTPNYLDYNDDNDNAIDDLDANQYGGTGYR